MSLACTASNSLTDLAYRIRTEHEAVSIALKDSVRHAIAAGELLIEAKAQLKEQHGHGSWLPWLDEHCGVSPRSAQVYMRLANHRTEIEANTQRVADLSLRGAIALIAPDKATKADKIESKEEKDFTLPEKGQVLFGQFTTDHGSKDWFFIMESDGHPGYFWMVHLEMLGPNGDYGCTETWNKRPSLGKLIKYTLKAATRHPDRIDDIDWHQIPADDYGVFFHNTREIEASWKQMDAAAHNGGAL